ncbi:MAG: HIT family hydrolase [Leptospira sp.]|nr:HIT family hydrolase [Leptospira sp.]
MSSLPQPFEPNCPICQIHNELDTHPSIVEYDELWVLRRAPDTKNLPGYLYLEPRGHYCSWIELNNHLISYGQWVAKATQYIQTHHSPRKIYTISIAEAVPHIHIHLIPHYGGEIKGVGYIEKALG